MELMKITPFNGSKPFLGVTSICETYHCQMHPSTRVSKLVLDAVSGSKLIKLNETSICCILKVLPLSTSRDSASRGKCSEWPDQVPGETILFLLLLFNRCAIH